MIMTGCGKKLDGFREKCGEKMPNGMLLICKECRNVLEKSQKRNKK